MTTKSNSTNSNKQLTSHVNTAGSVLGKNGDIGLRFHFTLMMIFAGGIAFWGFLALVYSEASAAQATAEQFRLALPFAAAILVAYAMLLLRSAKMVEQQGFLRSLANGVCSLTNNGYLIWNVERQKVYLSYSLLRLFGLKQPGQEISFSAFSALVNPDDVEALNALNKWMHEESSSDPEIIVECRMRHSEGSWSWMRIVASKIPGRDGQSLSNVMAVCTDIAGEVNQALRRQSEDARIRDAIDTLPEAFALRDREDKLVMCNRQFLALHGIPAAAAYVGAPYSEVLAAAANDPTSRGMVASSAEGNDNNEYHTLMQLSDGRWLAVSELNTRDGGYVVVETDVTQLKEQEQMLERQAHTLRNSITEQRELTAQYRNEKERAEGASRAKSAFLANVSHELRTPLTAVLGFAEVMHRESFGPLGRDDASQVKYSSYMSDIIESGKQLLELIEGILDMSRIEAGKVDLNIRPVNVNEIVKSCLRTTVAGRESKNIKLTQTLRLKRELPCDEHALRQVVLNLLTNAIKFTAPSGNISVKTGMMKGFAMIEVTDDGIGIEKSLLPKLGEPFVKGSDAHLRSDGAGLGLALCQKLVDVHNGEINIESEPNKGTRIRVLLPLVKSANVPSNDEKPKSDQSKEVASNDASSQGSAA